MYTFAMKDNFNITMQCFPRCFIHKRYPSKDAVQAFGEFIYDCGDYKIQKVSPMVPQNTPGNNKDDLQKR